MSSLSRATQKHHNDAVRKIMSNSGPSWTQKIVESAHVREPKALERWRCQYGLHITWMIRLILSGMNIKSRLLTTLLHHASSSLHRVSQILRQPCNVCASSFSAKSPLPCSHGLFEFPRRSSTAKKRLSPHDGVGCSPCAVRWHLHRNFKWMVWNSERKCCGSPKQNTGNHMSLQLLRGLRRTRYKTSGDQDARSLEYKSVQYSQHRKRHLSQRMGRRLLARYKSLASVGWASTSYHNSDRRTSKIWIDEFHVRGASWALKMTHGTKNVLLSIGEFSLKGAGGKHNVVIGSPAQSVEEWRGWTVSFKPRYTSQETTTKGKNTGVMSFV